MNQNNPGEVTILAGEAKITLPASAILDNLLAAMKKPVPPAAVTPFSHPALNEGEHYAGIILGKNGAADHHLILLPGEAINIKWQAAKDWAAEQGGELPTRREQSLLFANLKEQFKPRWHWSCEEHPDNAHSAFIQTFDGGTQSHYYKGNEYCALAFRRVSVI